MKTSLVLRHPSRQYIGLTQVSKRIRSEFLPLYHLGCVPFSDLARLIHCFPQGDRALDRGIRSLFQDLRCTLRHRKPIDITLLSRMDWSRLNVPFPPSLEVRQTGGIAIICLMLRNVDAWRHLVIEGPIASIKFTDRFGFKTIRLSLDPDMEDLDNAQMMRNVIQDFVRLTGVRYFNDSPGKYPEAALVDCLSGLRKMTSTAKDEFKMVTVDQRYVDWEHLML